MWFQNKAEKEALAIKQKTIEELAAIPGMIPTPIVKIDKDFGITYINSAGAGVLGQTPEACVGRKCYDLFKTPHCNTAECRCGQAIRNGTVSTGETVADPSGLNKPIRYTGAPVRDENGSIIGAVEFVIDMTEQKAAMDEAEKSQSNINNLPTPIMSIDKEFNVTFMNKAGAGAVGLTPEACIGKKCYSLFKTSHCQTENCCLNKAMNQDGIFTDETVANPNGNTIPIQYTGAPIKDVDGKIIGALEFVIDMTAVKNVVNEVNKTAELLNGGNLSARADVGDATGDYKTLIDGLNSLIDNIMEPVNESMNCLEEMAKGDLTVSMKGEYKGDHAKMKNAMNMTTDSLNDILSQVSVGIDQVASGSQQVSESSQSLSQGATEQASSLEETSASIQEINSQTKQNAENASQASQLGSDARNIADSGNEKMKLMLEAISGINDSSDQISKIIKVIDEIAFQTNLLALNAAVEAARAGVHGKGFAVVAEEVRNLAQRSAKAAKETTELIEDSVKRVENGTTIATETAKALDEIVGGISKVTDLVNEIASASTEQSQGIEQINEALGQIDQVTQSNTANAEESASASEELSGQAEQLKQMISKFQLSIGKATPRQIAQVNPRRHDTSSDSESWDDDKGGNGGSYGSDMIKLDDDDFADF